MIRSMLFLLLVALAACSPSRQIAVSATDAQARAGTIARLATHIGSVSTQPDVVADAATIVIEAQRIEAAAGAIHEALPGVEDQTPWWASLLGWGFAAVIVVAAVVLLWQTGIGQALRAAVGLIPRAARTEAALAAATLDPAHTENVREWISAKRAADPLFDVAFRAQQEKRT